ncbi:MAG: HAMP domain-containing protein [Magnetococcales bacterium]|nr:HAMP domain-containing protein [Magnetococcales bacterium]
MRKSSLRHKVILGYYLISALTLALSLFTLMELRLISQRVQSGSQAFVLLNNVLEMRRFEKNFFLYHKPEDMYQLLSYIDLVKQEWQKLDLDSTHTQMNAYEALVHNSEEITTETEGKIRTLGKALVTTAEEISAKEQIQVQHSLERHRLFLVTAMVVVIGVILLLGLLVSHRVVLPLRRMEESMIGVANGHFSSIYIQSNDREILSLTRAFNLVLDELQKRQKHLLRSEKLASLGTLLAGVAHELNNPLSNIFTSCQILTEEVDSPDPSFHRELLGQIDEQTRRARDIVRSLLDFARDRTFQKAPVLLSGLIEEVIRFSKGNIPARIRVRSEIPFNLILMGDRQRLQQAFINLLKNALDAIPEKGEVVIKAISGATDSPLFAGCLCPAPWTEIQIQDTGIGIPKEHIARIFDPFFTTKPIGKGAGLGLSVVFDVIEEHEGCIAVEALPNQGTCFTIRLPVATSDPKN